MNIQCPNCKNEVAFELVLEQAFCWAGGAIAFNCPSCSFPAYFYPLNKGEIEVGLFGVGIRDPIALSSFPVELEIAQEGDYLTVRYGALEKVISSDYLQGSGKSR
jgi:hypothetical protein